MQSEVVKWKLIEAYRPIFRVQENVGMLALYPDLLKKDEDPITEMIFVVDRYA